MSLLLIIQYDELAPRIKELKSKQDQLSKSKILAEAELVAQGVRELDQEAIRRYVADLRQILEEAAVVERKSFLRSFTKRIVVENGDNSLYVTNAKR